MTRAARLALAALLALCCAGLGARPLAAQVRETAPGATTESDVADEDADDDADATPDTDTTGDATAIGDAERDATSTPESAAEGRDADGDGDGDGDAAEDDAATAGEDAPDATATPRSVTVPYTQGQPDPLDTHRLVLPPLLIERRGDVRTLAVFPFYFDRRAPEDHQLLAGPYYRRRGREGDADVVFPFFWSFRGATSTAWSVPPVYYRSDADGFDFGIAPLVFTGRSGHKVYTVLPPLLTVSFADAEHAFTLAGPFWRVRSGQDVDWGLFPFAWFFSGASRSTSLVPPFYFRFEDHEAGSALTVVPPVYHRSTADSAYWGVAGLVHHHHDADGSSLTIPPLAFHYARETDGDLRLITPLGGYSDVDGTQTLVTPVYQRHRGDTWFDAVAPLFFAWGDERQQSFNLLIPPLVFHRRTPAATATAVLPFYAHVGERGRFDTWLTPVFGHWRSHTRDASNTWIFPTIQFGHDEVSSTFNIHPLVYSKRGRSGRHLVIAPLYWDFEDATAGTRATVGFPLYWRFRTKDTVSQLALNTYWHERRSRGVRAWEFHFFPFFAFGSDAPGDHWWNVLYGLVGYARSGSYARARVLWLPFQVDGPAVTPAR
jgi:hypothetical protein